MQTNSVGMSHFAWAVFDQLIQEGCTHDGDVVSKRGRNELIKQGLALRGRCADCGGGATGLTPAGLQLSARKLLVGGSA